MSEENIPIAEPTTEPNGEEAEPTPAEEKDWKAIARMWENRAKANQKKADKFDEIEEANKSELQKATERAQQAEAEAEALRKQVERDALVAKIATEKGVPASLLHGDDEEALTASADALLAWNNDKTPSFPSDTGGGVTPKAADTPAAAFARAMGQ